MNIDDFFNRAKMMRPKLLGIARRILGDDEEAEDVVQDAMLRLWQLRDKEIVDAESMARIVTRNLSIDIIRKRQSTIGIEDKEIGAEQDDGVDDEQINRIIALMNNLPTMQQTVMRLRHMDGMQIADIAKLTGSSEVAVRQSLSRARRTILNKYKTSQP